MNERAASVLRAANGFLVAAIVVNVLTWFDVYRHAVANPWHEPLIIIGVVLAAVAAVLWIISYFLQVRRGTVIDKFTTTTPQPDLPESHVSVTYGSLEMPRLKFVPKRTRTRHHLQLRNRRGKRGVVTVSRRRSERYEVGGIYP